MTPAENTKVVQAAYAAFGRGDIPALLQAMADDVTWHSVIGVSPKVPTSGVRHGRDGVAQFFKTVADSITFRSFEPREFLANGDTVVVLGHYSGVVKTTGRSIDLDWVMIFAMRGGKVINFREYTDAAAVNAAY